MQAAALQRQLVLKSCRPQLCKGNWCSSHAGRSFAKAIGAQVMQAAALQRQLVLKSCRPQLCKGNWWGVYIADCRAGYIITYIVIILGNMQAAALQRQLVLKSCRPQLCKRELVLKSCRPQLCKGNWCSSHAGRSFAKAIGARVIQLALVVNMQVAVNCKQ